MKSYFRKYQVQQRIHSQKESSNNPKEPEKSPDKELFESEFANLVFHPDDLILELNWKGFVDNESYRNILQETLAAAIERDVKKLIFNATDLQAITDDNRAWTYESWFAKVKEKEIETFAFVMPKDIFGEVSLQMIADKVKELYKSKTEFFKETEEALVWIKGI